MQHQISWKLFSELLLAETNKTYQNPPGWLAENLWSKTNMCLVSLRDVFPIVSELGLQAENVHPDKYCATF